MFGKLSWDAIPLHEPIIMYTLAIVGLIAVGMVGSITWKGAWGYLWREWFTSVDHKKIGCMYIIVALVMLLRGFSDAIMMRTLQAMAAEGGPGYLPPEHYDQIFTAHGVIMIFFMAMPFMVGLLNIVVPLQIGTRRGLPVPQRAEFLAVRGRCRAGEYFAGRRRIREDRMGGLSPAL